jgi:hypothetical protein
MDDDRIAAIENRVDTIEQDLSKLRETAHRVADSQQVSIAQMTDVTATLDTMKAQLSSVTSFIDGTDHVLGFCRKHWRTILKFGAGVVTAYGFGNPHVQRALDFILKFAGI